MSGVDSGGSVCDLAVTIWRGEAGHTRGRMTTLGLDWGG